MGWSGIKAAFVNVANGVGLFVMALFFWNRELARKLSGFDGISPWWCLIPLAWILVSTLLRAAHRRYEDAVTARDAALVRIEPPDDIRKILELLTTVTHKTRFLGTLTPLYVLDAAVRHAPANIAAQDIYYDLLDASWDEQLKRVQEGLLQSAHKTIVAGGEQEFLPLIQPLVDHELLLIVNRDSTQARLTARGIEVWRWSQLWTA